MRKSRVKEFRNLAQYLQLGRGQKSKPELDSETALLNFCLL